MNLQEKIQSLTAKEIIMTMVEGLKNPYTQINMGSFGHKEEGICYGCAATNTLCKLVGNTDFISEDRDDRSDVLNVDLYFLRYFETAIDWLRLGNIEEYNHCARQGCFAQIKYIGIDLPRLETNTYKYNLQPYIDLANGQ